MTMRDFFAVGLALLLVAACAPPQPPAVPKMRLATETQDLRHAAARALKIDNIAIVDDEAAPLLSLRETISENRKSLAADGSVGAHEIQYVLFYRLDGGEERKISRDETVDHDENDYLGSREQRRLATEDLRRAALTQMLRILELEAR